MVFDGFGTNFDDFWSLGDRLEIHWILRSTLGHPRSWQHARSVVFGLSLVPIPSAKQFPGAIQHAKYIMKHAGMKGYEKAGCKLRKYEKSRL